MDSENNPITPPPVTPLPSHSRKKYPLLIATGIVVIALIFVGVSSFFTPQPLVKKNVAVKKTPSTTSQTNTPPKVAFKLYSPQPSSPSFTFTPAKTYALKSNFSLADASSFAQKFGLSEVKQSDPSSPVFYNTTDMNNRGMLTFNTNSGFFSYTSLGDLKPSNGSAAPVAAAQGILQDVGMWDSTLSCPITYQREGLENITFVECHRNWNTMSAPLVSIPGILNIPEATKLASLQVGQTYDYSPTDPSIVSVSNGENGKARPNDFNTVTVGVTSAGRILSIDSSLRWIHTNAAVTSQDLISESDALALFRSGNASISLTLPAGSGITDWNKVYPNNLATSSLAQISDVALVYLEQSPDSPQSEYAPYYVIRGTSQLDSGYTVKYVQAVSALKKDTALTLSHIHSQQMAFGQNAPIQAGNFGPTIIEGTPAQTQLPPHTTYSVTPTVVLPTLTPITTTTTIPSVETICQDAPPMPDANDRAAQATYQKEFDVPGYGKLKVMVAAHTIYWISTTIPNADIDKIRDAFSTIIEDQYMINIAKNVAVRPDLQKPTSLTEVKSMFESINKPNDRINQSAKLLNGEYVIGFLKAPVPGKDIKNGAIRGQKIYDDVVQRTLTEFQNNTLSQYSTKPNIFNDYTMAALSAVIWDLDGGSVIAGRDGQPVVGNGVSSCWISGESPSIFLYSEKPTHVTVSTTAPVTYADPAVKSNTWNLTTNENGTLQTTDGIKRDYLYYEYDKSKVKFTDSAIGFIAKKDEWKSTVTEFSKSIALNQKETERLISEIQNALPDINSEYLKLSLIPQSEIDSQLPLSISPKPDHIHRIHFLVSGLEKYQSIKAPSLNPISRDGFTVIELGEREK